MQNTVLAEFLFCLKSVNVLSYVSVKTFSTFHTTAFNKNWLQFLKIFTNARRFCRMADNLLTNLWI